MKYLNFCPWELFKKGSCIFFLIVLSFMLLSMFTNITKSNKKILQGSICDSEKQSKFILDCIKEDKTKTVVVIRDCERISIGLYCK